MPRPSTPGRNASAPARGAEAIDTGTASVARVYDAFLGGKDNYEIDRAVLRMIQQVAPDAAQLATGNREFLVRAVRFLAGKAGLGQFLDCGSGLPAAPNVHQVVQRANPDARVVYIDNDPVAAAHGRALLEENDRTHFLSADIFEPREILEHETVRAHIDFAEPLAFLQVGTFMMCDGERSRPAEVMREYIDALPPGSWVAFSHFLDPENEYSGLAREMERQFLRSPLGRGTFRTRAELEEMLDGLELARPGLSLCADWWPDGPRAAPLSPVQHCLAGAVGRKP